ncbi:MAG: glycosyltransferase [Atopobiaceae bacterium]
MTPEPLVSVIVPAYNAQGTIGRCVDSILGQSYRNLEVLVMDDGSTDDTPAILDKYQAQDSRMRVVHKENSGVSDSRNRGLDLAQGTYVQFLDADDWITNDATRLLVRGMQQNDADMVIANFYRVIGERVSTKGDIDSPTVITREEYADRMSESPADFYYGVLWNKLYKRSIIQQNNLRMDPNISWSEDFIFNMEYVLHTDRIYPLQTPIYYYVKTKGSIVQGSDFGQTVQMKLTVVQYYRDFYRQVYDPDSDATRKPAVYRYLMSFASDGGVTPGMPSTKKLGEERGEVRFNPAMSRSSLADAYYYGKLMDRCLTHVAQQYDLTLCEVKVLMLLKRANTFADRDEIAEFLNVTKRLVSKSITRLLARHLIETRSHLDEDGEKDLYLQMTDAAQPISEAIERAWGDVNSVRFKGFDGKEIERYKSDQARIRANIVRYLTA